MSDYKDLMTKFGFGSSPVQELIQLVDAFGSLGGSDDKNLRETSNSLTYLSNLYKSIGVDNLSETETVKNLVLQEKNNAPEEYKSYYDIFSSKIDEDAGLIL